MCVLPALLPGNATIVSIFSLYLLYSKGGAVIVNIFSLYLLYSKGGAVIVFHKSLDFSHIAPLFIVSTSQSYVTYMTSSNCDLYMVRGR
jgi:hypothetical protein